MRNRQRALDVVGDRLARRVRQVVERQNHHVIADADAAVFTPVSLEVVARHGYHRFVLRL